MVVPEDLQKLVGKKEMRYSLKTGYLGVAKHKARLLAGQVQFLFEHFRKGGAVLSMLSDDQIKQLVHRYVKDSIDNWDRGFFAEPDDDPPGLSAYEVVDSFEEIRDQFIAQLNEGDLGVIEDVVDNRLIKMKSMVLIKVHWNIENFALRF
jgi:hypothetical protein